MQNEDCPHCSDFLSFKQVSDRVMPTIWPSKILIFKIPTLGQSSEWFGIKSKCCSCKGLSSSPRTPVWRLTTAYNSLRGSDIVGLLRH